jgi:hypothetical protein
MIGFILGAVAGGAAAWYWVDQLRGLVSGKSKAALPHRSARPARKR